MRLPSIILLCVVATTACRSREASEPPADGSSSGGDSSGSSTNLGSTDGESTGAPPSGACALDAVGPVPQSLVDSLGLDPFYVQHLDADGLPVLASGLTNPEALVVACDIALHMLSERPDVLEALIANGIRIGVMATTEVTTDIPEHADLYDVYPGTDWDARARGLGATLDRPASTVGEENLLHLPEDVYAGESIMVHEFAHTIWETGVLFTDAGPSAAALADTYDAAIAAGLWQDTYAATDHREYWAEAAQSWFDTNLEASPPDGVHNEIDTRVELVDYDPAIVDLLDAVFPDDDWVVP